MIRLVERAVIAVASIIVGIAVTIHVYRLERDDRRERLRGGPRGQRAITWWGTRS